MGLLPYRKLARLEINPDKIVIQPDESLQYYVKGKNTLTIPLNSIAKVEYVEQSNGYGIILWQKDSPGTFFFPYFTQSSFEELLQLIK